MKQILQGLSSLIVLWILGGQQVYAQQAWVDPQGSLYTQFGASYLSYNSLLQGNNPLASVPRSVSDLSLQFYGQYVPFERFMISANIPLKISSSSQDLNPDYVVTNEENLPDAGTLFGLGNATVGFSYNFLKVKGFTATGHARLAFRPSNLQKSTGLQAGYQAWGLMPSVAIGYGHQYFFASTEFGMNYRTHNYSTQLFSSSQLGTKFKFGKNSTTEMYVILTFDALFSLYNQTRIPSTEIYTGLYLNNIQFQAPGAKLGLSIKDQYGIWLATSGLGIAGGRDLGGGPSISLAFFYKFKPKPHTMI